MNTITSLTHPIVNKNPRAAAAKWLVSLILIALLIASSAVLAQTPEIPAGEQSHPNGFGLPYPPQYHPYDCLRNFFVATNGSDANDGESPSSPWLTLSHANSSGRISGDCINVAPGLYTPADSAYAAFALTVGGSSNSRTGYVVYRSTVPYKAHITGAGLVDKSHGSLIGVWTNYVIIDGFDLDGTSLPGDAVDGTSIYHLPHHIMILNNRIHDAGSSGISLNHGEYYVIHGNEVYKNANTNNVSRSSGISVWHPKTVTGFNPTPADNVPFHIEITGNVVYDNILTYTCTGAGAPTVGCPHSDGNGIILDDWQDRQYASDPTQTTQSSPIAYAGSGLVQSNLVFENGGAGVTAYYSTNVTVANNTAYDNFQDLLNTQTNRGELVSDVYSGDGTVPNNVFINNIGWAAPVSDDIRSDNTGIFDQSYPYGPTSNAWTTNIIYPAVTSSQFVTTTTDAFAAFESNNLNGVDPLLRNFRPREGSPALGAGTPTPAYAPRAITGHLMRTPPDIGAYCRFDQSRRDDIESRDFGWSTHEYRQCR